MKKQSIKRMQSVRTLIAEKMMMVDAPNYHAAMLAELWNLYYDEGKVHLCQNIMNYCKVENAFNQIKEEKNVLLISIKDSSDNVKPYAYFKNNEIESISNNI